MLGRTRVGPRQYEPYLPTLVGVALGRALEGGTDGSEEAPAAFAEAAILHGIAGQALLAGRSGQLRLGPQAVRRLEAAQAEDMVISSLLRSELGEVGSVIASACGLPSVLLKGPAVADRFYADPEHRAFVDLDLLLPPDRVAAAADALVRSHGYHRAALPWPQNLDRHGHAVQLHRIRGAHTLVVELHWRLSDDPVATALDHARVAAGAERWPAAAGVLVPDRSLQLLLLAIHLVHHLERRLIWLVDLRRIGESMNEDEWLATFTVAQELRLDWVLHRALDEVERVTGDIGPRPQPASSPVAWGPLRAAQTLGGGAIAYHAGHLATLSFPDRVRYLIIGTRRVLRRALQARPDARSAGGGAERR